MDPATFTLARRRGSRTALVVALARDAGPAGVVRCWPGRGWWPRPRRRRRRRSSTTSPTRCSSSTWRRTRPRGYVDLRLRHAALGYLPPGLDGAPDPDVPMEAPTSRGSPSRGPRGAEDRRTVDMTIRLDEQGAGVAVATEELAGWPALEWAELVDRSAATGRGCARTSSSAGWGYSSRVRGYASWRWICRATGPAGGGPRACATRSSARRAARSPSAAAAEVGGGRPGDAHRADLLPVAAGSPVRGRAAAGRRR